MTEQEFSKGVQLVISSMSATGRGMFVHVLKESEIRQTINKRTKKNGITPFGKERLQNILQNMPTCYVQAGEMSLWREEWTFLLQKVVMESFIIYRKVDTRVREENMLNKGDSLTVCVEMQ